MKPIIFIVESIVYASFIIVIILQFKKTVKSFKEWKNGKVEK